MPVVKKLKSGSSHPASPPAEVGVKGKGMAPEPMEVDDGSPQVGEESSGGGSHSELDSELSEASENESGDSLDTDAEIELAQQLPKSKQTLKRKRRAIPPSSFGQALTALLETSTSKTAKPPAKQASDEPGSVEPLPTLVQNIPDTAVLALKKTSLAKKRRAEEKSEAKAAKAQSNERKEREDRNRVTDVIGGWGGESERALRKVAQRGVVKLFNVIQQAQQSGTQASIDVAAGRGTGKATLPAPSADAFRDNKKGKGKGQKDNAIGRAKPAAIGQQDFLESIRSGGIVSKV